MNQTERRRYLIEELLKEHPEYAGMEIPKERDAQKMLLRSLMNIRMPGNTKEEFLRVQDAYLLEENEKKGVVTLADMEEPEPDLFIWRGDTRG